MLEVIINGLKSRTIVAAIVGVVLTLISAIKHWGLTPEQAAAMANDWTDKALNIGQGIAYLLAIIFRVKATTTIAGNEPLEPKP